jgi:hypothetical protein
MSLAIPDNVWSHATTSGFYRTETANELNQTLILINRMIDVSRDYRNSDQSVELIQAQILERITNIATINRRFAVDMEVISRRRALYHAYLATQQSPQANVVDLTQTPATSPRPRPRLVTTTKVMAKKKLEELCPNECAVCQETPKYKDAVCSDCNHYFCKVCWDTWMNAPSSNLTCPTCRKVRPKTTTYRARASPSTIASKTTNVHEIV